MSESIISISSAVALPQVLPLPRLNVHIRPGTLDDLPFIDALQNKHYKMVGYMWTKQLEGKIAAGHVLIAEEGLTADGADYTDLNSESAKSVKSAVQTPVGYCIGNDQYFKRDDVGIIYQMNVAPDRQRGLIGATLVKAMFDRAAWGCKLFCCWCAQDIAANYFWESLGFVPLAFRAGSRKKRRVHIFWQRRIRAGDTTTPYWFPSQTTGGSIREDRLVLPIPPGTHWKDAKPMILPGQRDEGRGQNLEISDQRSEISKRKYRAGTKGMTSETRPLITINSGGLRFVMPKPPAPETKPKKEPKPKAKNDPKHVAAARELRDRWLEQINSGQYLPEAHGKYEVGRRLEAKGANQPPLFIEQRADAA